MNAKSRLDAIEDRMGYNDESCSMIVQYWDPDIEKALMDPICPNGHDLSRDLHECRTCSVPEKYRHHILLSMTGPEGKHVGPDEPSTEG